MVGIELARIGAIIIGIGMAFVGSMFFLSIDRRALEWSRVLRKRMSGSSEQAARLAAVRIVAAE